MVLISDGDWNNPLSPDARIAAMAVADDLKRLEGFSIAHPELRGLLGSIQDNVETFESLVIQQLMMMEG